MSQAYFLPHHPCYSRNVAKDRAWREYHLAVADEARGPDHPATLALWGRVKAYEHDAKTAGLMACGVVAFIRAQGRIPGYFNRAFRKVDSRRVIDAVTA